MGRMDATRAGWTLPDTGANVRRMTRPRRVLLLLACVAWGCAKARSAPPPAGIPPLPEGQAQAEVAPGKAAQGATPVHSPTGENAALPSGHPELPPGHPPMGEAPAVDPHGPQGADPHGGNPAFTGQM